MLPIAVILFLFPLGKGNEIIEVFGMIVAWVVMIPILIIFSWDLAGCIIYIWKNKKNWKKWIDCCASLYVRLAIAVLIFISILILITYLTGNFELFWNDVSTSDSWIGKLVRFFSKN